MSELNIPRRRKPRKWVAQTQGVNPIYPPLTNATTPNRDLVATLEKNDFVVNRPVTPITCAGTSFECEEQGSGNTPIVTVDTRPSDYDIIATDISDAGITGVSFQPDFILNWNNNSIATGYTKCSLKNTYGFENFQ